MRNRIVHNQIRSYNSDSFDVASSQYYMSFMLCFLFEDGGFPQCESQHKTAAVVILGCML